MDQLPMSSTSQADRMLMTQVGVLYQTLSPIDAAERSHAFRERARVCHADARSQPLSNGTRVGAAFDVCAFVLLFRLAQQRLVFDGLPEVVERIAACLARPYEDRVPGFRRVVQKHLGRYEAPAEFSDEDVAVALEVAELMLQDLPRDDEGESIKGVSQR